MSPHILHTHGTTSARRRSHFRRRFRSAAALGLAPELHQPRPAVPVPGVTLGMLERALRAPEPITAAHTAPTASPAGWRTRYIP